MEYSFDRLKAHESIEKDDSMFSDRALVGYLELVKELYYIYSEKVGYEELIEFFRKTSFQHEIFYEQLYNVPGKTLNDKGNKAKTEKARKQAYKIMWGYIKKLRVVELNDFIVQFV